MTSNGADEACFCSIVTSLLSWSVIRSHRLHKFWSSGGTRSAQCGKRNQSFWSMTCKYETRPCRRPRFQSDPRMPTQSIQYAFVDILACRRDDKYLPMTLGTTNQEVDYPLLSPTNRPRPSAIARMSYVFFPLVALCADSGAAGPCSAHERQSVHIRNTLRKWTQGFG